MKRVHLNHSNMLNGLSQLITKISKRSPVIAVRIQSLHLGQIIPSLSLVLALSLAFYVGLLPKQDYLYPLHVDEWIHLDDARSVIDNGKVNSPLEHEFGFHLLLAELTVVTGLDWFLIMRWFPPVCFAMTTLLVYLVGRKFGAGLEGAFLVTLVPTTVRFLGPAFSVPVAIGMMMLPLSILIASSSKFGLRHSLLLGGILIFALMVHPTSAILISLVMLIHILASISSDATLRFLEKLKKVFFYVLLLFLPAAVILIFRWHQVLNVLDSFLGDGDQSPLPQIRDALSQFGILPTVFFCLGFLLILLEKRWQGHALALSAAALLGVIVLQQRLDIGYQSLADRGWLHFMVLMSIIGGIGLRRIVTGFRGMGALVPQKAISTLAFYSGFFIASILLTMALTIGQAKHRAQVYYQLADDKTMADFAWISEHLSPKQKVAVMRTDIAYAYLATTRGPVFASESWPFANERGAEARKFLFSGDPVPLDNQWWIRNGVEIIYAPHWAEGGNFLDQPRQGIFVPPPGFIE